MKKTFVLASAIVLAMFILSGCIIGGPKDEKQAFIDATIESTCLIFQQGDAFDPELETKVKDIFAKYDFKVDDNVAMEELSKKYVDDEAVGKAIMDGVTKCSQGVTGLPTPEATETPAVEETTPEATETPAAEGTTPETEAPATEAPAAETPAAEAPAAETPVSLLKVCPEEWIDNNMPSIVESNDVPKEYFIYKNVRRELSEFDVNWVKANCSVKPQTVY